MPEVKESKNAAQKLIEIQVDPVDDKIKYKLVEWLVIEVKLIKNNNIEKLVAELPSYCRNGVFLFDLINQLNGKHAVIMGLDRNPKTISSILANINKVLEYFRTF